MDNISFAKNMNTWSQKSPDSQIMTALSLEEVLTETNEEFNVSLNSNISDLETLISCISTLYKLRPRKELYDVKIHLAMAKHLLKSIKHENS